MNLEHILGQVDANSRIVHGGSLFRFQWLMTHFHFGTFVPVQVGVSTPLLTLRLVGMLRSFLENPSARSVSERVVAFGVVPSCQSRPRAVIPERLVPDNSSGAQ